MALRTTRELHEKLMRTLDSVGISMMGKGQPSTHVSARNTTAGIQQNKYVPRINRVVHNAFE